MSGDTTPTARIIDPAHRHAWARLARLWRPMAAWSALVWAVVIVVLTPLSSALLGWSWLRGTREIVANEALLSWAFSPYGAAWILMAGTLSLVGLMLHFAGIFEIVTEDLEGIDASVPVTALRLALRLPTLARLCAAAVLAALVAALPLVGGLAAIHQTLLGARDINYYLAERPPEWWTAVGAAATWVIIWAGGATWLLGRSLLAVPACLDGDRPLAAGLRHSWRATRRGEGGRIVRVITVALVSWLLVRAVVDAGAVAGGRTLVAWTATASESLRPLVAVTGGWALLSLALDSALGFLGIAYVSTLVAKLYHEDTELHVPVRGPGLPELSGRIGARALRWFRPGRLVPALAVAVLVSSVTGGMLLERIPDPRPVTITAHRAGPPPAPENTLAALERSISAGADRAEIDVQLSRDGVPVVIHDADLMRMTGDPRRVSRTTYREMSGLVQRPDDGTPPGERRVATLAEFLERSRGRIDLMIELKYYGWDPALAREVLRVLREHQATDGTGIMSLDVRAIRQLRELGAGLPVGYAAAAVVGDASRLPVSFLALSRSAAAPSVLRSAHRRGMDVHVWTVNRAVVMAEVIQEGADGLITDRPRRAVRVREELAEMPAAGRILLRFGHLLTEEGEEGEDL